MKLKGINKFEQHLEELADRTAVDLASERAACEMRLGQITAAAERRYWLGLAAYDLAIQRAGKSHLGRVP